MALKPTDDATAEEKQYMGSASDTTIKPTAMINSTCAATVSSKGCGRKIDCSSLGKKLLAESVVLWGGRADKGTETDSCSGIPQGCQFSPDGTCLLTARANRLELYNTPYEEDVETDYNDDGTGNDWKPALTCNAGESVRSYAWYPHMKSSDPATCCFLGVSRDSPVNLYDAYDGSIRATYRPYNALDEMESPTTLCFVENGQKLVTGGLRTDRILHVFDINRPGREHSPPLLRLGKTRRSKDGQKGLVSALAYSEQTGVIAVGTYSPGSIYLYDLRTYSKSAVAEIVVSSSSSASSGGTVCVSGHGKRGRKNKRKRFAIPNDLEDTRIDDNRIGDASRAPAGVEKALQSMPSINFAAAKLQWYQNRTRGGVTQVEFENDGAGHSLFSTSRRSNAILQWDLRNLSSSNFCPGIASFETDNDTNQRIEFQIYGDQIWTGGRDGCVRVYSHRRSTAGEASLLATVGGFQDSVNGISLYPDVDSGKIVPFDPSQVEPPISATAKGEASEDSEGAVFDNRGGLESADKSFLAVAVGSRHFPTECDWESDNSFESLTNRTNNFVGSTHVYALRVP
mmetsp:Transcript_13316/g.37485  ORF Transcript_13316/g.37485 Transcript_13316/m.37485 type:complete len:570 (-) Transcript_13316:1086-2795(-)|eukprot:CAMPEP_0172358900 /NCGR_PEP_ID=MMETSP1060-20121228/3175_1 /TAXON_ID=37318 /ORGANISM="Pseudo-nitzschia pungens, Strain cf. cingulata" /LENGTH=569 /DNA_ID=CAMNT_0013080329 /DNA_START=101 /DNA_END=1810 /DNA_ORIENTATION=-